MSTPQKTASSELFVIPSHQVASVWEFAEPLLMKNDRLCLRELFHDLVSSDAQLWGSWRDGWEAALVTKIQNDHRSRFCLLLSCGGSGVRNWAGHLPHVETWAKSHGCDELRIYGRRGWAKLLGFEETAVEMSKTL